MTLRSAPLLGALLVSLLLSGCATVAPRDYTEFRKSSPRSILVLPPLNESNDVAATYSVLTAMTRPLAELGYYVFPVVLVDQYLKENGLTVPGEMHQAPLPKLREVFGADAVLYLTVGNYGNKYKVLSSASVVHLRGQLVDARTGTVLWDGAARVEGGSGGTSVGGIEGLLAQAIVQQIINKTVDAPHATAALASAQLVARPQTGLLRGPYHPDQFGTTPR